MRPLVKTIQKRIYDFLLTKYGILLLCISLFVTLVFVIHLSDTIIEYRSVQLKRFSDVIKFRNASSLLANLNYVPQKKLTSNENDLIYERILNDETSLDYQDEFSGYKSDIDVVYTWVNGSDLKHLEQLKKFKISQMESEKHSLQTNLNTNATTMTTTNRNNTKKYRKVKFEEFAVKFLNSTDSASDSTKSVDHHEPLSYLWPCYHKLCMQTNNLIIIKPVLTQSDRQMFLIEAIRTFDSSFYLNLNIENHKISQTTISPTNDQNDLKKTSSNDQHTLHTNELSVLSISNYDFRSNLTALSQLEILIKKNLLSKNYKVYMGFYTIDCNLAPNCIRDLTRTFIAKRSRSTKSVYDSNLQDRLNRYYSNSRLFNNLGSNDQKTSEDNSNKTAKDSHLLELPKHVVDNLAFKFDFVHVPSSLFDGASQSSKSSNDKKSKRETENLLNSPMATYLSVFKVKTNDLNKNLSQYLSSDFISGSSSGSSSSSSVEPTLKNENFILKNRNKLIFTNEDGQNITYDLYRANIVWDLGDPFEEDVAENRFQDNDELKYSLRSLEKYAPWVRNIYLVTNGQVPNWLNLSHPRIKLVTHEEIFRNKSHLPTFSSPAIESHLHRIKGLSKKFIYFNDDVLLARPTWPDDFFTRSKGFKLRLAWALPGCNQNCPNSWIRDGYCDKACNTSECDFDGGDCDKNSKTYRSSHYDNSRGGVMNQSQILFPDFYCSAGCATSWLADKYCDNSCNVAKCAFDMGDCGVSKSYGQMYGINLFESQSTPIESFPMEKSFNIPTNTLSFYINFTTNIVENANESYPIKMTKANYEDIKFVRTISIVNKFSVVTVLLMPAALSSNITESFKIHLAANLNKSNAKDQDELKITLTINLNSFINESSDFSKTTNQSSLFNQIISSLPTSTIPSSTPNRPIKVITFGSKKRQPEMLIAQMKFDDLPLNLTSLYPNNLQFSNQFIKSIYENYFNYLNWSFNKEYLSELGLRYKLYNFYKKLSGEIAESYKNIINTQTLSRNDDGYDQFYETIFEILSNDQQVNFLSDYDKRILVEKFLNETSFMQNSNETTNHTDNMFIRFRKRKLLDTFADSLRHVNRLFNDLYGYIPRKVPAHSPHMIDRQIMRRLIHKFKQEFDITSGNRMRSSNDMQFSFSYYYFLMSELDDFNESVLFDELDINRNGVLDDREIAILNLRLSSKPFSSSSYVAHYASVSDMYTLNTYLVDHLNECKLNHSNNQTQSVESEHLTKTIFISCKGLVDFLKEKIWNSGSITPASTGVRYKYKYETLDDDDTKFVMIGGDPLEIEIKLNNLIREPKKFICLNDNIDYKMKHEAIELKRLLKYFYSSLYPIESSFEILNNQTLNDYSNDDRQHLFALMPNDRENEQSSDETDLADLNYILVLFLFVFIILIVYLINKCFKKFVRRNCIRESSTSLEEPIKLNKSMKKLKKQRVTRKKSEKDSNINLSSLESSSLSSEDEKSKVNIASLNRKSTALFRSNKTSSQQRTPYKKSNISTI